MITRRHFLSSCAVTAATPCAVSAQTITQPFNITVTTSVSSPPQTNSPVLPAAVQAPNMLWQPGVTYNGGIPNRTTIYKTLSPSGGDDGPAILAACNSCPAGQVVQLTAGTFQIASPIYAITNSNFTLRGAGPGTGCTGGVPPDNTGLHPDGTEYGSVLQGNGTGTFLVLANRSVNNSAAVIYVNNAGLGTDAYPGPCAAGQLNCITTNGDIFSTTNLATDALPGSYSCTTVSPSGVTVGEIVLVSEDTWTGTTSPNGPGSAIPGDEPDNNWGRTYPANGDNSGNAFAWFQLAYRGIGQIMRVVSVSTDGLTITFETPFHHVMRSAAANNAAVVRTQGAPGINWVTGVGIEEMAVMGGMNGNINFSMCSMSWLKHVECYYSRGPCHFTTCYRCEARDSYFHESPSLEPGGGGYLIAFGLHTSDSLIENCIMWMGDKVNVMQAGGGGNVIGYCYTDDALLLPSNPDLPEAGINTGHSTASHMELVEGCYSHKFTGDTYWGNQCDIVVLRSWFSGLRKAANYLANLKCGINNSAGQNIGYIRYTDMGGNTGRCCVDVLGDEIRHYFVGNILGFGGAAAGTPWTGSPTSWNAAGAAGPGGSMSLIPAWSEPGAAGTWSETGQTGFRYEAINSLSECVLQVVMWVLGGWQQGDNNNPNTSWSFRPNTYLSMWRQGNYDYVTNSQLWFATPMGASGTTSTGTPQTIPNSLYLTSKPPFFNTGDPWPWVDPSTGRTAALPAKRRFDNGTPNLLGS